MRDANVWRQTFAAVDAAYMCDAGDTAYICDAGDDIRVTPATLMCDAIDALRRV
jgi:hypothetical protein